MIIGDDVRDEIETLAAGYPKRRGGLLPALHLVQEENGYVSLDAMRELAELFELRPGEVLEVVSFYDMLHRDPIGRHDVRVCTNLSCSLRGARTMLAQLSAYLGIAVGETSDDGRITLGRDECLGACASAPMMRVGDVYYEDLDLERASAILDGLE